MTPEIPTTSILDRHLSRSAVSEYRDAAAPVLAKIVDEGLAAFERCSSSARGGDENTGILFPALHVFEMLDGIDVLLLESAVVPAQVILRSAFEAVLTVGYVTEGDTTRRGAAYVVVEVQRRIREHERWDATSAHRTELVAEFQKDEIGKSLALPTLRDAKGKIEALQSLLKKPHLIEAAAEFQRLKGKGVKRPAFHAFWGGPRSVQDLARHLKKGAQYEVLYRKWSLTAHAFDLGRQLTHKEGLAAVRPFRNPEDIARAYTLAFSFGLETIKAILNYYRAEEITGGSFGRWYVREVQQVYQNIAAVRQEPSADTVVPKTT